LLQQILSTPVPNKLRESLDPWQKQALEALYRGEHVVVDAPTSAGKTRIVECFFQRKLETPGFRAIYTTPVKSLAHDKLKEFREIFGKNLVGISTGDLKENLYAPVVVATLESYRNSLLGTEANLKHSLVVFDEYHYIQDYTRGSAWEESIILNPPHSQLLLLSASVRNANQFASWLEHIHQRSCKLVSIHRRPVPLKHLIFINGRWLWAKALPMLKKLNPKKLSIPKNLSLHVFIKQIVSLKNLQLTPSILYAGRRASVVIIAKNLSRSLPALGLDRRQAIKKKLQSDLTLQEGFQYMPIALQNYLLLKGVVYHHSGLMVSSRMTIETLLKDGYIDFCVATMGLSLGINFSVKSTVLSDFTRPSDRGAQVYPVSEIIQMLGRAGRRGKDIAGFACWPTIDAYRQLWLQQKEEDCVSNIRMDPTTFLGLVYQGFDLEQIEGFYTRSFRRFCSHDLDMTLLTTKRLQKRLKTDPPCLSAIASFSDWQKSRDSHCQRCSHKLVCHPYLLYKLSSSRLAALHGHLHFLDLLTNDGKLHLFGQYSRHFPQFGGLLIAKMLSNDEIQLQDMTKFLELLGALSLSHFKRLPVPVEYVFPYPIDDIKKRLMIFYPYKIFEDNYDTEKSSHSLLIFRDFNPSAGWLLKKWLTEEIIWDDFIACATTNSFENGDVMNLFFKVGSFLQSITRLKHPMISQAAQKLRQHLLRSPLDFKL